MASGVPPPLIRRPISIGVLAVATVLWPILFPIGLLVGLLIDAFARHADLRRFRGALLVGLLTAVEVAGFIAVTSVWFAAPLGFRLGGDRTQDRYRRVMTWWATSLLWAIRVAVPLRIDLDELDDSLLSGGAIVVGRHRSMLDAILPAAIFGPRGLLVRYSLKEDLRWEPNIDLVGHFMGHRFVTRNPANRESELLPLRRLAALVEDDAVGVIFPEGTFFTPERKRQAVARLAEHDPGRAEQAERLRYLLPPRPAGTLAMLEGNNDADVIVLAHVGYEPFGTVREILANVGGEHPIAVRAWRYDRSEIPDGHDARIDWLFDVWTMVDQWVADTVSSQAAT